MGFSLGVHFVRRNLVPEADKASARVWQQSQALRAARSRRLHGYPPTGESEGDHVAPLGGVPGAGLTDEEAMQLALTEATAATAHGDVPVGAVALVAGTVVASHHNERELRGDPTAHAELLTLRAAAEALGGWRLGEVTMVVTLEPCPMCAGALVAARVGRLVYGATDPKAGACGSLYNLCSDPRLNHELPVTAGVLATDAAGLLQGFFADRRR
jgi:tRNA(adenine34) deaminase